MKFNIHLLIGQCILFLIHHELTSVEAMIGRYIWNAPDGQFLYTVSIMRIEPENRQSGGEHFCNGVLVSRKDILTTAHCISDEALNNVQLLVGTNNLTSGSIFLPLWWQTYDQWADVMQKDLDYFMNDMAIIRLIFEVPERIIPIQLSTYSNTELYGKPVIIVGWGVNNQGILPDNLRRADLKVIENRLCERRLKNKTGISYSINVRVLCTAATPYVLIDEGDSGGPIIFQDKLVAINKGTCPGEDGQTPKVKQLNLHLGVEHYRDFINYMISLI